MKDIFDLEKTDDLPSQDYGYLLLHTILQGQIF